MISVNDKLIKNKIDEVSKKFSKHFNLIALIKKEALGFQKINK